MKALKTICSDSKQFLKHKWFYVAIIFTIMILWFDIWSEEYVLLHGTKQDITALLSTILGSNGTLLSLPFLAALPYSASIYQELSTNTARYVIFRCGYRAYLFRKMTAILLSAVISQLVGLLLFGAIISFVAGTFITFPAKLLLQRLIAASLFAMTGNIGALLSKDIVSAYLLPVMFVFALSMFQSRFFFEITYLNPVTWLSDTPYALPVVTAACLVLILLSLFLTIFEVKKYV